MAAWELGFHDPILPGCLLSFSASLSSSFLADSTSHFCSLSIDRARRAGDEVAEEQELEEAEVRRELSVDGGREGAETNGEGTNEGAGGAAAAAGGVGSVG
jgi:hypothetical protein